MKKWKLTWLAGLMAVVLLMTACSGKPADTNSSNTGTSETGTEGSSETGSEASGDTSIVEVEAGEIGLEGMNFSRKFGDIPEDFTQAGPNEMDEAGIAALDRARAGYSSYVTVEVQNQGTNYYYYDLLTPEQQLVYDGLYLLAMDPTSTDTKFTIPRIWRSTMTIRSSGGCITGTVPTRLPAASPVRPMKMANMRCTSR